MKKTLIMLLCIFGMTTMAKANLVANDSFESGMDNWTTYGQSGVSSIYFAVKNEAAYDGSYSMKIAARNGYGMVYQTVAVTAGTMGTLSFWAHAVSGDWMMNEPGDIIDVNLKFIDSSGAEIAQPSFIAFDGDETTEMPILSLSEWLQYSVDFEVPVGAVSMMVKIRSLDGTIDGGARDGTGVYIDSVSVICGPAPVGPEVVQEADLDNNRVNTTFSWKAANDNGIVLPEVVDQYVFLTTASDPNMYFVGSTGDPLTVVESSFGPKDLEFDGHYRWQVVDVIAGQERNLIINQSTLVGLDPNSLFGAVWSFDTIASKPVVVSSPIGSLVSAGDDFTMTAEFQSITPLSYKWYYSADNVVGDDTELASITNSLTISGITLTEQGYYYCAAVNASEVAVNTTLALLEVKQMVLSYPMENSLEDVIGDNDATPSSTEALVYVPGIVGDAAVSFNGTNQFAMMPWVISNSFTIEFWVKTTSTGGTGQWYSGIGLIEGDISGTVNDFGTTVSGGKFAFGVGNPDTTIVSNAVINDNNWHHCVATRDHINGDMAIYVDGMREKTGTGGTGTKKAADDLRIGKLRTGGGYLNGAMDAVRMYNYPLSENEVAGLYYDYTGQAVCIQSIKPLYDLNTDCKIDIADLAMLASVWLDNAIYTGSQGN